MPTAAGIIGAGNIAETQYIPALKKLGLTHLFIHDLDEKRADSVALKHKIFRADRHQLLSACDTVILTTPPEHHFELLQEIIPNTKRVICEKPFVFRKADAEILADLAFRNGCELLVAHIKRIFPAIRLAKELIQKKQPGPLLKAELFDGSRSAYKSQSGYITQNKYGGVLLDSGSHAFDCLLYTTGLDRPGINCSVLHTEKDKEEPSHEFSARLMIDHADVSIRLSRYEALSNKMNLHFRDLTLEVPFDLKPYVRLTDTKGSRVTTADTGIFNYISEAFKQELSTLLSGKAGDVFGASRFIPLASVLEKLYFHA